MARTAYEWRSMAGQPFPRRWRGGSRVGRCARSASSATSGGSTSSGCWISFGAVDPWGAICDSSFPRGGCSPGSTMYFCSREGMQPDGWGEPGMLVSPCGTERMARDDGRHARPGWPDQRDESAWELKRHRERSGRVSGARGPRPVPERTRQRMQASNQGKQPFLPPRRLGLGAVPTPQNHAPRGPIASGIPIPEVGPGSRETPVDRSKV